MLDSVAKIVLADRLDAFAQMHKQFLKDKPSVVERDEFADYLDEESNSDDLLLPQLRIFKVSMEHRSEIPM